MEREEERWGEKEKEREEGPRFTRVSSALHKWSFLFPCPLSLHRPSSAPFTDSLSVWSSSSLSIQDFQSFHKHTFFFFFFFAFSLLFSISVKRGGLSSLMNQRNTINNRAEGYWMVRGVGPSCNWAESGEWSEENKEEEGGKGEIVKINLWVIINSLINSR